MSSKMEPNKVYGEGSWFAVNQYPDGQIYVSDGASRTPEEALAHGDEITCAPKGDVCIGVMYIKPGTNLSGRLLGEYLKPGMIEP